LILLVKDYVTCLTKAGFTKFYFINGHGGNIATLKAAFSETYAHLEDLQIANAEKVQCQVANWFMCSSVYKLAKELYGIQEGSHATPSEVAVTQYIYPEAIKQAPLSTEVGTGHKIYSATDFRQRFPDGRMGSNPALATPEHGKQFYDLAVKELSNGYLEFVSAE
jgi:creatinine amidohydrolase